jgi:dCTP deaminase
MIEGRSSIGRLGLFVHVTAGFGDVGFCGFWTLEMFAVQPVRIYAGVAICQIFYHRGIYLTPPPPTCSVGECLKTIRER